MLRKLFAVLFSGLIAALLPACDHLTLEKFRPGQTTMAEVRQVMGEPTMTWTDPDGSQTWEYARTPNGIVNYMIDFTPNQVVKAVRQVITEENFTRIQPGMTKEEIRRLLGQPAHELYFTLKKEYVWDWKTKQQSDLQYFFNVHFNDKGRVTHTSTNASPVSGG